MTLCDHQWPLRSYWIKLNICVFIMLAFIQIELMKVLGRIFLNSRIDGFFFVRCRRTYVLNNRPYIWLRIEQAFICLLYYLLDFTLPCTDYEKRIWWSTLSKALATSKNIAKIYFLYIIKDGISLEMSSLLLAGISPYLAQIMKTVDVQVTFLTFDN